jgi:predicted nucleic acid-binding protein
MTVAPTVFLDTNVVVYAHDGSEPTKGAAAQALISALVSRGWPLLSVQVLSEFYWSATRKIQMRLSHDEAVAAIARLNALTKVIDMTPALVDAALQAVAAHGFPLWDAQLFAVAKANRADVILSEDFSHRRTVDGITFLNPFAADFDPAEVLPP